MTNLVYMISHPTEPLAWDKVGARWACPSNDWVSFFDQAEKDAFPPSDMPEGGKWEISLEHSEGLPEDGNEAELIDA